MPTEERLLRHAVSAAWRWPGRHPWWFAGAFCVGCLGMLVFAVDADLPFRRMPLLRVVVAAAVWLAWGTLYRPRWRRVAAAAWMLGFALLCHQLVQTRLPHWLFLWRHRSALEASRDAFSLLRPDRVGPGRRLGWSFERVLLGCPPYVVWWDPERDLEHREQGHIAGDWYWTR